MVLAKVIRAKIITLISTISQKCYNLLNWKGYSFICIVINYIKWLKQLNGSKNQMYTLLLNSKHCNKSTVLLALWNHRWIKEQWNLLFKKMTLISKCGLWALCAARPGPRGWCWACALFFTDHCDDFERNYYVTIRCLAKVGLYEVVLPSPKTYVSKLLLLLVPWGGGHFVSQISVLIALLRDFRFHADSFQFCMNNVTFGLFF